jgi:hypothetical protein
MHEPTDLDEQLHAEADALLASGLRQALGEYGEVHVVGSYALRLMVWRDLDIHIVREPLDREAWFALGGRIAALLRPPKMHFRDETVAHTPDLPAGFYWGIYLGDERAGAWKIEVWATDRAGFDGPRRFGEQIAARLTPAKRAAILAIKSACWTHPQYRKAFASSDVYAAVLEHGIATADEFWQWLRRERPAIR